MVMIDPPPGTVVPNGVYRHYKGSRYLVIGTVFDATHEKHMVLYHRYSGTHQEDRTPFARTVEDFTSLVGSEGNKVTRRFTPIDVG